MYIQEHDKMANLSPRGITQTTQAGKEGAGGEEKVIGKEKGIEEERDKRRK